MGWTSSISFVPGAGAVILVAIVRCCYLFNLLYSCRCKKQVFDQQFSEKLVSADFGKQLLHILIDKAVMRQRAAASLLGA